MGHDPHDRKEKPRRKKEIKRGTTEEVAFNLDCEKWVRFRQAETQPSKAAQQNEELTALHFEEDFLNP